MYIIMYDVTFAVKNIVSGNNECALCGFNALKKVM